VEAAGIEPASRNVSAKASTCVVGSFPHFAKMAPNRLGPNPASQELF